MKRRFLMEFLGETARNDDGTFGGVLIEGRLYDARGAEAMHVGRYFETRREANDWLATVEVADVRNMKTDRARATEEKEARKFNREMADDKEVRWGHAARVFTYEAAVAA